MTPANAPQVNRFVEFFKENFEFIVSPQLQRNLFFLKLIFIFFSLLFLIGVIYLLVKTDWIHAYYFQDVDEVRAFKEFGAKKWQRQWRKIKRILAKNTEIHFKLSLIEAGRFFSDMVGKVGFGEGDLGEQLKQLTENDVSNLEELSQAHQICQDIIRDPDYQLSKDRAHQVIDNFEKALTDLSVL